MVATPELVVPVVVEAIEKIVLGHDDRLVLRIRHELDRLTVDGIREVLDRVLGPNRAIVIVDPGGDVELDVVTSARIPIASSATDLRPDRWPRPDPAMPEDPDVPDADPDPDEEELPELDLREPGPGELGPE